MLFASFVPPARFRREPFIICCNPCFTLSPKRLVWQQNFVDVVVQGSDITLARAHSCAVQWIMFLTRLLSKT
jgi:hypothetical protein